MSDNLNSPDRKNQINVVDNKDISSQDMAEPQDTQGDKNNQNLRNIFAKSWRTHRKIWIVVIIVIILLALTPLGNKRANNHRGIVTQNNNQNSQKQSASQPSQPSSNSTNTPSLNTPSTPSSNNGQTYFQVVWSNLSVVGQLSQKMDQDCGVSFPPPEPCYSEIQAYQQELLKAKSDLSQVSAPASFAQPDATMRSALDSDIQASSDALNALQSKNLKNWLSAIAQHGKDGQELDAAGQQALGVLR